MNHRDRSVLLWDQHDIMVCKFDVDFIGCISFERKFPFSYDVVLRKKGKSLNFFRSLRWLLFNLSDDFTEATQFFPLMQFICCKQFWSIVVTIRSMLLCISFFLYMFDRLLLSLFSRLSVYFLLCWWRLFR